LDALAQYASDYYHSHEIRAGEWFAVYVRARHEFIVHEGLVRKDIETYLPTVQRHRQWKDRRKLLSFPLFPGYLFVNICPEPHSLLNVLKTTGAVRILSAPNGKPIAIPPQEIESLRLVVENGQDFGIYPSLREGARIRIKTGSFRGVEGVLAVKGSQYMCIVNIAILGRSVGITIHAGDLEAV